MKLPFPNQYYVCLERDLTSRNGFRNPIGEWVEAPDWDPSRNINCGKGFHVVRGHPLFALKFVTRSQPIYARVEVSSPVVQSSKGDGKYRVQKRKVVKVLTRNDPEFSPEVLIEVAAQNSNYYASYAAKAMLARPEYQRLYREKLEKLVQTDPRQRIRSQALEWLPPKHLGDVIAKVACEDPSPEIRIKALRKLSVKRFGDTFVRVAQEDTNAPVRRAAAQRLSGSAHGDVLEQIVRKDPSGSVREAALEKLPLMRHEALIVEQATKKGYSLCRLAAIRKLSPKRHRAILEQIRDTTRGYDIRRYAQWRLRDRSW